eukprot:CAMPEP_0170650488 /NCGR_PEP_ID=MMETSP0224-20130122/45828_1 /TAXON_ID=285029 /ORGANISM="Togula jolla, Strain CCCM 725" /LENGTH=83 /DNA_ID=CAMNT_0010982151 /DNA_START=171 /DNA_END=422 /DNA_ORIENTATION=-
MAPVENEMATHVANLTGVTSGGRFLGVSRMQYMQKSATNARKAILKMVPPVLSGQESSRALTDGIRNHTHLLVAFILGQNPGS